jgi:class 3 adenylate cyclase
MEPFKSFGVCAERTQPGVAGQSEKISELSQKCSVIRIGINSGEVIFGDLNPT